MFGNGSPYAGRPKIETRCVVERLGTFSQLGFMRPNDVSGNFSTDASMAEPAGPARASHATPTPVGHGKAAAESRHYSKWRFRMAGETRPGRFKRI